MPTTINLLTSETYLSQVLCPVCRESLRNPDLIRRMFDPENVRAMAQMQQAMQQLSAAGLGPSNPLGAGGLDDFGLGGLGGVGGLGSMLGGPAIANPQEFYSSELQQLQVGASPLQVADVLFWQAPHPTA
jgi:hypothetical protein